MEIGDYSYNYNLDIFQENCSNYTLPKITQNKQISESEIIVSTNAFKYISKLTDQNENSSNNLTLASDNVVPLSLILDVKNNRQIIHCIK